MGFDFHFPFNFEYLWDEYWYFYSMKKNEYSQLLRDVADDDEVSASLRQHTLKTTFMLLLVHRPPMRLWRSSLDEVLMK